MTEENTKPTEEKPKRGRRKSRSKRQSQTITFDAGILAYIEKEADKQDTSLSRITEDLIRKQLKEDQLEARAKPIIVSVINNKGGVAKSTTTSSLAYVFGTKGYKVLMIDFDGQSNLSMSFDVFDPTSKSPTIFDVMFPRMSPHRSLKLKDVIKETSNPNVKIIPSDFRFGDADFNFRTEKTGADIVLQRAIESLEEHFDIIFIDCGPRTDLTASNAIAALNAGNRHSMIIIPVKMDAYSIAGIPQTISAINEVAEGQRIEQKPWRILKTIVEEGTKAYRMGMEALEELSDLVPEYRYFETSISKNTKANETGFFAKPLTEYDANSKAAMEYRELADEIEEEFEEDVFPTGVLETLENPNEITIESEEAVDE